MTGFGDGSIPDNNLQYLYTLVLINIGLFTFAYTVGVLGAMGSQGAQQANEFQVLVHSIACFVERYNIQDALLDRITSYLQHRWQTITSGNKELVDAAELLERLPRTMRYEAVESMTMETLNKVPLFARVEEGFIHALTQKMQAVNCSIGETLVRQGEVNETFYIVLNGSLSMTQDGRKINDLQPGSFFGERTLLSRAAAKVTVVSTSFCELYRLQKTDLQMLRINFPDTFAGFEQAAKLEAKNAERATRAKKMTGGSVVADKAVNRWIITPNSSIRAIWSLLAYLALAYDLFTLPFKLVFIGDSLDPHLLVFDVLSDFLLLLDTALQFMLAFHINGRLITEPKAIRNRYLNGSWVAPHAALSTRFTRFHGLLYGAFLPTALSSIPWTILMGLYPAIDARILQLPRLFRLLRVIPVLRADVVAQEQPTGLDELLRLTRASPFDMQYTIKKLLPLAGAYIILAHYFACGYFAVVLAVVPPYEQDFGKLFLPVSDVKMPDRQSIYGTSALGLNLTSGTIPPWSNRTRVESLVSTSEWLPSVIYLEHGNVLLWYLRSIFFSVCNLTGLGKSPVPTHPLAVQYTILTFVVGVLVFAYITSSIVTLVMNSNAPLVAFRAKKNSLLGFMDSARVPNTITVRASHWLDHWWYAEGATPAGVVIDHLPPSLREEVRLRVFQKTTQASRVFLPLWDHLKKKPGRQVAEVDPEVQRTNMAREQMTRELITAMTFEVYNPGEWVLHKGMLNEWLYIVTAGTAEVLLAEEEDKSARAATRKTKSNMRASRHSHLLGKIVAELEMGDVFGEISVMYRNKCEASVRAKTPLEVIAIPRLELMKVLHRSQPLMQRLLAVVRRRRRENDYFKLGNNSLGTTMIAKMAAQRVSKWIKRKMAAKRAAEEDQRLSRTAEPNATVGSQSLHA